MCLQLASFLGPVLTAAIQGADKLVKIWDADSGEIINTLEGHTEGISDIAWSSDGDYLASASDDKTIIIWNSELVRDSRYSRCTLHTDLCDIRLSLPEL